MNRSFTQRLALIVVVAMATVGCTSSNTEPEAPTPAPTNAVEESVFDSQFTKDGTYQSHIEIDGVDFVYTVWPTKATPRTNEWYPGGDKTFSFTLQAYDLRREFEDPFDSKRNVYLETIRVTSTTTTESGRSSQQPYRLDALASTITFDPEPLVSNGNMLITSPKGAFELRNQVIGTLASDTIGVTLVFEALVYIQSSAVSSTYKAEMIREEVPIRIFPSTIPTESQEIPYTAN